MELINLFLRVFWALLLFTVQQADAQTVTVTIGEFAGGVFIEWVGFLSDFPVGLFFSSTATIPTFVSNANGAGFFVSTAYSCK